MNFELNGEELSVLLVSLIGRRNNVIGLLKVENMRDAYYESYNAELVVVENLLEKFFPGSIKTLAKVA